MNDDFDPKEIIKTFYKSPFDEVWLTCKYVDECEKKVSRLRYYIKNNSRYAGMEVHKKKTRIQMIKNETKNKAIKTAKELGYSDDVIKQLEEAKTDVELGRIMKTARVRSFRDK